MNQQEICQILKQIIPELQTKIKMQVQKQYQIKLQQIRKQYEYQIQDLLGQKNRLPQQKYVLIQEHQQQVDHLYKKIVMLQSQRKQWSKLQSKYQQTIQQLTNLLQKQNVKLTIAKEDYVKKTNQSTFKTIQYKSKQTKLDKINIQSFTKQIKQQKGKISENRQLKSLNLQKPVKSGQISGPLSPCIKIADYEIDYKKNHYQSVLSPPKQNSYPVQKKEKRILWDQTKKKQLLSLIKLN